MALSYIDAIAGWGQPPARQRPIDDGSALDAYSRVVAGVAKRLAPSVASLRIRRPTRRGTIAGGGSAVAIASEGYLVTSAHVVAGHHTEIRATFVDGRDVEVAVVGIDALSDLAVLAIRRGRVNEATLGDADSLRVGQLVVAIGNPYGFAGSVTAGVVSDLGRSLPTHARAAARIVENVVQTDAALSLGTSGGALVDGEGRVVGITTAVAGVGLGLAVPINYATRAIIDTLIKDRRVRRWYLGIAGGTRPLPLRLVRELEQEHGVEVMAVAPGSPAERGGLRPEDLIVALDAVCVRSAGDIQRLMTTDALGTVVDVTLVRDGEVIDLEAAPEQIER